MVAIIIAVVITLVVVAPVTLAIANSIHKKQDAERPSAAPRNRRAESSMRLLQRLRRRSARLSWRPKKTP